MEGSPPIFLTNTLTRKLEEFKPLVPGEVSMYTCGPTVYSYAHIGNFRAFLMADTLRRVYTLSLHDALPIYRKSVV